ncbi:hypothetical protein Tco_1046020 [Tanacetum coccineum]
MLIPRTSVRGDQSLQLACTPASRIPSPLEDLTTLFLLNSYHREGHRTRNSKQYTDVQQHHGESLSEAWTVSRN